MHPGDTVFYDASYSLLLTRKLLLNYMIPEIKSAWVKIVNFTNAQNGDNRFHRFRGTIIRFSTGDSERISFSSFIFTPKTYRAKRPRRLYDLAIMRKIYLYTRFWNVAFIYTKFALDSEFLW